MRNLASLRKELYGHANKGKAKILSGFFKTGKGEYGEGDIFIGVTVPQSRAIAKKFHHLEIRDIGKLLRSKIHEERLVAILLLVHRFMDGGNKARKETYDFYLKNTKYINNWDLVDLSADKIVGAYLLDRNTDILHKLTRSKNIWERRIAVIATFQFIKNYHYNETIRVCSNLLEDDHDLIHKAAGWMLREVGKRSLATEELFLKKKYKKMPRTMLRYAIERFPEKKRKEYLEGKL
ncbi:MAG: DNA alkylation repair protein [Patescibacteria group bacterium]